MPKKNKKKNRRQMDEEVVDDWDKSESDDQGKIISSKDIKKNKKKKNKKNKNKQQTMDQSDEDNESAPPQNNNQNKKKNKKNKKKQQSASKENDDWNESNSDDQTTKPVQKLSKKEMRRLKKQQKQQQNADNSDEDDDGWNDSKNKKKNNKKKNKKNKKRQSKVDEAALRAEKLAKLKEQRQTELLNLGNNLLGDLEVKYAPFLTDELNELWEAQIFEFVQFYDDDASDWENKVEDDALLKEKKQELRDAWNEIFELIQEDYNEASAERDEKKKAADRQKKLEALRAQGLNIGTSGNKQSAAQKKAQAKREQAKKLKKMREILREKDRLALEKEREEMQRKKEEEVAKQREMERLKKEKEEKEALAAKEAAADWDDSSDEDEPLPPSKNVKNGGKKKQNKNAFADSDEESTVTQQQQKKKKAPPKKKQKEVDPFGDSDDEQPVKQQPKKKRNRKKKKQQNGGNNGNGNGDQKEDANSPKSEDSVVQNTETKPTKQSESSSPKTEDEPKKAVKAQKKSRKQLKKEAHAKKLEQQKQGKQKGGKKKKDKKKVQLRSPICVVMGHVDTGKTKILDHIRSTSVQDKEAGGITQQIGATYLSIDYIKERTARLKEYDHKLKYKIPGLLFIDTPGHESFSNLRSRGSSMCDIAVLVVDLMHGLEPQTIESLKMLQKRKSPFIVALNKIDVCYDWKQDHNAPFLTTYKNQSQATKNDFDNRLSKVIVEFAEQGVNAQLYTKNKRMDRDISLVPTSAHSGEGIPDLLYLIVQLTKKYMENKIAFNSANTKASVLEVKQTQGYGATIDVIVSDGTLRQDDVIVICGMDGAIVTPIRALLLPHEAQEMRVKGEYKTVESVSASVGVRIAAKDDLSGAVAGAPLFIVPRELVNMKSTNPIKIQKKYEQIEDLKFEVQKSFSNLSGKVDKGGRGVFVQSSTLGSLEALITFLYDQKIPVSGIGIGTISKKTVMRAAVMINTQPEYAVILAFNVKCAPDARVFAEQQGVKIFEAEIIYHLQDMFEDYIKGEREKRKNAAKDVAVFPCEFKIISPQHVFHNKNPLVLGVQIVRGSLRLNTPIVAQRWNAQRIGTPVYLGRVDNIKSEDKEVPIAKLGDKVSIRIMGDEQQKNIQVGRSFDLTDNLISEISRDSIDALKNNFEEEMKEDGDCVQHLGQLKKYFNII